MYRRSIALQILASFCATAAMAKELNTSQMTLIRETVTGICNTITSAKGQKSESQIVGDVKARLGGLAGKLADAGLEGKASMRREAFEGLSQEATADALQEDRYCRERIFKLMFATTLKEYAKNSSYPEELTKPDAQEAAATFVGQWVGTVICPNDKNFLITLEIKKQNGDTASGEASWSGHIGGGAHFRLVPDPNAQGSSSYIYIADRPNVYSYKFTRINKNKLAGQSIGTDKCGIVVER